MTREEIQDKAVDLIKTNNHLLLEWSTGVGKSKAAIDIIKYVASVTHGTATILLVVAELAHKKNWEGEFLKWGLPTNAGIVIETYASLKKHRKEKHTLIILDEVHHAGSDLRLDILMDIEYEKVLALTATITDDIFNSLCLVFGTKITVSKVTLKEAIDLGILPEPKVYLIPMDLDDTYPVETAIEEWGKAPKVLIKTDMKGRWDYLKHKTEYPNVRLEIKCTAKEKHDFITGKAEYWKSMYFRLRVDYMKNKWLQAGSERKRFLGDLKSSVVKGLLSKLSNQRFICFCTSINQANELGGRNAIHSDRKDSLSVIDQFNNKQISSLFAVGMVQEGQNLTDIEAGIIVQLDGGERAFVQKMGRAMRADSPKLFIFYYKNTRDEEYLLNVLETIDPAYVTEVDDIFNLKL